MLPLRENVLYLTEIAECLFRELGGVMRTQPEIYAELLGAFWQRELATVHVHNLHSIDRENVLKAINDSTRKLELEHPGFTLVESAERIPPKVTLHQDRSATIDQDLYIVLPPDPTDWTDEILRTVYDQFAKLSLDDFHEWMRPPIDGLGATREALAAYCSLTGRDRPRFWFRKDWAAAPPQPAETPEPGNQHPPTPPPLTGKAKAVALNSWADERWGSDRSKLPGRETLLKLAREEPKFAKVTQKDVRDLRRRYATEESKRGGRSTASR